jgi:hypothetical protein
VKLPDQEFISKGDWREELHPRDEKGRFTTKPSVTPAAGTEPKKPSSYWKAPDPFKVGNIEVVYEQHDYNPSNSRNHEIIESAIKKAIAIIPSDHSALIKKIIIDDDITNDVYPTSKNRVFTDEDLMDTRNGIDIGAYTLPDDRIIIFNGSAKEDFFSGLGNFGAYDNIILHEVGHLVFTDMKKENESYLRTLYSITQSEGGQRKDSLLYLLRGNERSSFEEAFCGLYRHYVLNGPKLRESLPETYHSMKRYVFKGVEYMSKGTSDVVPLYIYELKSGVRVYSLVPLPGLDGTNKKRE